ncbi:MAG: YaiI/YqxD family protein [Christensenellales bacterium]
MRILIDADGCPVVDCAVCIAKQKGIECLILCDTAHEYEKEGATTLVCSKGGDSVDFALVNLVQKGDIVITQDYGLAAMCLAREAAPLSQDGMAYTAENIDMLLYHRHIAKKIRRAGGRIKGPSKRSAVQDKAFCAMLEQLIEQQRS